MPGCGKMEEKVLQFDWFLRHEISYNIRPINDGLAYTHYFLSTVGLFPEPRGKLEHEMQSSAMFSKYWK